MSTDWPAGYARRVLQSVDSTNAEAARIAGSLAAPEWILALTQTAARGRRGRAWVNPPGNFAATLVLICDGEAPAQMALRSFVASLALYDALTELMGTTEGLSLKWPNDVLLNGGKLAGILMESLARNRLAIGIGVNLAAAPSADEVEREALAPVSLAGETGALVEPSALLAALARAYAQHEAAYRTHGFMPIRALWLSRAARLGQPVTARTGAETVQGTFTDIDETGNMLLRTASGIRRIAAADIYF